MRVLIVFACLALLSAIPVSAATLEKLTLDDMALKSTTVVRVRVLDSYVQQHGALLYTHYRVQASEWWKGSGPATLDVVVPGGTLSGIRQSISGAPKLAAGSDHVLFLWKSPRGLTHILGLSQGLFDVAKNAAGETVATRAASTERIIDRSSGRTVADEPLTFRLSDLRQRVNTSLAAGGHR
jgi:hypothetical protein